MNIWTLVITNVQEELSFFRSADNANPQILIDIALGRSNSLPANELCSVKTSRFTALKGDDIHRWKLHYGLTLKIAAIEQSGGNDDKKVREYLEWIYRDYVFLASAVIFGIIYFSRQRIRKMLKGLNSGEIEKVKRGLRNAAWDMTLAHYWSKKAIVRKNEGEFGFYALKIRL